MNTKISPGKLFGLVAWFAAMQANFTFMEAPTKNARFVHAPIFAAQLIGVCYALDWVESGKSGVEHVKKLASNVSGRLHEKSPIIERDFDQTATGIEQPEKTRHVR